MLESKALLALWERLLSICSFSVSFESPSWTAEGKGSVFASKKEDALLFVEEGAWTNGIHFKSSLRWKLDLSQDHLLLEHLRYGKDKPVFLAKLRVVTASRLESVEPHLCFRDSYQCSLYIDPNYIRLIWHIEGPKKKQKIEQLYACSS